ncbi:MAG: TetR/AcrR family transcriptional regulator [Acidimicrobiales bacterium]|jgi:AcrR family transcriptional regulator
MATNSDDLGVDAILELFESTHADEARDRNEGLRERKKRQVRQRISDVATAMFLVHGFDNVTVAQIAAESDVSQQTVFNYFTTKESMFFDRTEPMITAVAEAVRERGNAPLIDVVVESIASEIHPGRLRALDDATQLHLIRRFCAVATTSPTLAAARYAELPRFVDEVSMALAQRVGADPIDPGVRFATFVIAGLVEVRVQSAYHHVEQVGSFAALNEVIHHDFLQAARLAEPSLTAFDNLRPMAQG